MQTLPDAKLRENGSCERCIHYQKAHGQHYDFECESGWYMDLDEDSAKYCPDYQDDRIISNQKKGV